MGQQQRDVVNPADRPIQNLSRPDQPPPGVRIGKGEARRSHETRRRTADCQRRVKAVSAMN